MNVITAYVEDNNLGGQIFVADKPQGIAITLSDRFLFDVGRAELKPPAFPALRQLSGLFSGIGASISIEGHTDNTPVSAGSQYNDNWDLSGARALSVLRFFWTVRGWTREPSSMRVMPTPGPLTTILPLRDARETAGLS